MNPSKNHLFDMNDEALYQIAVTAGEVLQKSDSVLVAAESCTGGWVAKVITDVPGSSAWFDRGFVTYTNIAKHEMLGVANADIEDNGAVSEIVVAAMAKGALENSTADLSVAISGVAGPTGGSKEKPVGTVCFAWHRKQGDNKTSTVHFTGDRDQVRRQAVGHALEGVIALVQARL